MRKFYYLLLFVAFVTTVISCKKEKSNEDGVTQPPPTAGGPIPTDTTPTGNTEVGVWKFVNLTGTMANTAEFSQAGVGGKLENTGSFTSQNNGGTVTFNNSTMTANGITMAVNATTTTKTYLNGVLVDTRQTPLNESFPAQDATSAYTKVGADSLHFADGGFLNALTGGLLPSTPTGCKLKFEGNLMKMTIIFDTVTTQDYQGVPAKIKVHTELVATLQKN
ncbi:hypothetical protein [Niastella sp. OAS944]|uniref:hypothetical protein n=1 Tax=Niastella sp. OAS944 TaxID=2664089 RepID=UPI0034897008|nr:hypothetical protein [Chitinophagaceae bacterium OAS944]